MIHYYCEYKQHFDILSFKKTFIHKNWNIYSFKKSGFEELFPDTWKRITFKHFNTQCISPATWLKVHKVQRLSFRGCLTIYQSLQKVGDLTFEKQTLFKILMTKYPSTFYIKIKILKVSFKCPLEEFFNINRPFLSKLVFRSLFDSIIKIKWLW